ncbi:MAG: DNRLRE domain-containing protein [Phycisphaerae bacterium]
MAKSKRWSMALALALLPLSAWASEVTILAGDDVYVGAAWPTSNRSSSNTLYTDRYFLGAETWLKFNLSPLIPPTGRTLYVNSATLRSYGTSEGSLIPVYQDAAWFCDNDTWTETTITWNNRPTTIGAQLVAPWVYQVNTWMESTGDNLTARVQQETIGDHFLSMKANSTAPHSSGTPGHSYNDNDYSSYGFQLKVDYDLFPLNTDNLFLNPCFAIVNSSNLPVSWSFWFNVTGDNASVDNVTYAILPFNPRNVLRFNDSPWNWNCFYQHISVYGGIPYLLSMTHRESSGFDQPLAAGIQYSDGSFSYLNIFISNSNKWTAWSQEFTPTKDDNVTIYIYNRGAGTAWFSDMSCKPNVPDSTPTGPVAPFGTDNVTWSGTANDISTWLADNITVSYQDGKCVATVAGGKTYGRLSTDNVSINKTTSPFLTLQVQQDSQTGGFAVVVDGQPVDLMPYDDDTGSGRIEPRDVPGIITYDLRKFSGIRDNMTVPVQIYVAGTSKQVKFSWIKMANRPQPATVDFYTNNDYLVFHRPVFSINDYQTIPTQSEVDNASVAVTMSRNQTESESFCVYSRIALNGVNVSVSDLSSGGATIPASSIDVRAVKVWYQDGSLSLVHCGKVLEPELLLYNDALITVNRDNQTNILNFADLPQDSLTLQSLNIEANTTKEFWLTIKPPVNMQPGSYQGTITVTSSNGTSSYTSLPITVTILPFDLQGPGKTTAMYTLATSEDMHRDLSEHGISGVVLSLERYTVDVTGTSPNYTYNFTNLKTMMDSMVQNGIQGPIVLAPGLIQSDSGSILPLYGIYSVGGSTPTLAEVMAGLSETQKQIFNGFLTQLKSFWNSNNYPEFWIYLVDEPSVVQLGDSGTKIFYRCVQLLELVHAAGLKGTTAVLDWPTVAAFDNVTLNPNLPLDYPNYTQSMMESMMMGAAPEHRDGLYYPHPVENPVYNRAAFGLFCWYSGSTGFAPWIYMGTGGSKAYDDFADFWGLRYAGYAYPAQDGKVIDTIEWEALRSAVDDLRYLNTLKYCVDQTSTMTVPSIVQLRQDSQNLLNTIPDIVTGKNLWEVAGTVAPEQFQAFRDNITAKIIQWVGTPLASDGTLNVEKGRWASGALVGKYLGNDNSSLTYSIVTNGSDGVVSVNPSTGAYDYIHTGSTTGTDSFTFRCTVNGVNSNIATVTINITESIPVIIPAGDDVFVGTNEPDHNYAASTNLFTSRYFGYAEVWLKFDLSSLVPPSGYGLHVNSAYLQSNGGSAGDLAPAYQDAAWFCDNDTWSETTITWNNRPTVVDEQLVVPWTYQANAGWGMSVTDDNLTARVGQETMGDHFLSMMVNGATQPISGSVGHYYNDNDYSAWGFRIVVDYSLRLYGDVNGDGVVNSVDLSAVLTAMDSKPGSGNWNGDADMDKDGEVTSSDLSIVLVNLE